MHAAKKLQHLIEIDAKMVEWCNRAVAETFESLFSMTVMPGKVVGVGEGLRTYEISGVIGFIQEGLEGTMTLGFHKDTLSKMMTAFYGEEVISINEQMVGGISEMTNIVFGIVKQQYNDIGFDLQMCLPVVIVGANHHIFSSLPSNKILLQYEVNSEPFWLEISTVEPQNY